MLFIAVTDGYDSEQREAGLVVCKSNIFNKYYSRNLGKNQGSSPEQFPWHCPDYCTEKRGENRYLAEAPKTYSVSYDANNSPTGSSMMCSDPNLYTSEEAVTIMDREAPFPLMGNIVKFGYNFVGWNMEPDGTGTDYARGRRQALQETFTSMQSGRRKAVSSVYLKQKRMVMFSNDKNDADPETCKVAFHAGKGSVKVKELIIIKDGSLYLPLPERAGYDFTGWYLDDDLTRFAGAYHDTYRIIRDTSLYAKWEKTKEDSSDDGDNTQYGDGSNETLSTYTIKYDANGGKTRNASVKVVKGGTVSGNSAESPSDKNSETKTEGGNGNAGKGTEPVIQTGHASPFILLAVLGLCGALLACGEGNQRHCKWRGYAP